jgi:hypothetical protein
MHYNKTQDGGSIQIGEINTTFAECLKKQTPKEAVEYRVNITTVGHMTATWSVLH